MIPLTNPSLLLLLGLILSLRAEYCYDKPSDSFLNHFLVSLAALFQLLMPILFVKKILIQLVRIYQRFISPLFPPSCRYHPTCSNYMIQAIQVHGALKGSLMGIARILRCHPFVKGGVDYVPLKFSLKRNTKDQHRPNYDD